MKELKNKIENIISSINGTKAVYIKGIDDKIEITINPEQRFHSASIIKIFYLYEALKQVQEGKLKLDQTFKLSKKEKVGGSGVLQILHSQIELTVEDLLHLMIDVSDNTATNMLFDILGKENINNSLHKLGIDDTYVARKLMVVIPGLYSYSTVKDTGKMLEEFINPKILDKNLADKALEILSKQQYNDCISRDLIKCGKCDYLIKDQNICPACNTFVGDTDPKEVYFPHKTGEISGVIHDAGIMHVKDKKYIVVIFTKNLDSNKEGKDCLKNIGVEIYNYLISK